MFSRAPVKRFNEEISCVPAPTAYDPKGLSKANALSIDKSDRWKENKENTPAPNAYNFAPRTPGRSAILRTSISKLPLRARGTGSASSSASLLNSSISSTNSADSTSSIISRTKFLTPPPPSSLRRKGSNNSKQLSALQQLRLERDALTVTVDQLKLQLRVLELRAETGQMLEKEVQTEQSGKITMQCTDADETPVFVCITLDDNQQKNVDKQLDNEDFVQEKIKHLTQLRDNLEASVARKDELIAQLEAECRMLVEDSKLNLETVDQCNSRLKSLEDKLAQSFLDRSNDCDDQMPVMESFVGRVAGLVLKYEVLLDSHTSHTHHCTQELTTLNLTLSTLNGKVSDYEQEIASLKTEVSVRSDRINNLEETVTELKLISKEKEMMETVMQEEICQRNQEMSMLEEGYTSLEQKVAEAEQRSAAVAQEREKRDSAEKRVQELQLSLQEAEVVQQFLEKEIQARELEITSAENTVEELGRELEMARKVKLELQGEAEAQLNEVIVLKANLATKDYDIDDKEETIMILKEEIINKDELVYDLQEMLTFHKTAKVDRTEELEQKTAQITKLEEAVTDATASINCHIEKLGRHEREKEVEITCLKDMHAAELQGLKEEKGSLLCRMSSLHTENTGTLKRLEDEAATIKELEDKLDNKEDTVKELEDRIVDLMAEISDSDDHHEISVCEVRAELDELSTQYSDALLELEGRRRALQLTAQQNQQQQLVLQVAQEDLQKARAELSDVQNNLSGKSEEYTVLELSLVKMSNKYTALEQAKVEDDADNSELLRRLRAELSLCQQNNTELRHEQQLLHTSNAGFMTQIQQLRQDLSKKAAAMEESKVCIELLREEKNILSEHRDDLEQDYDKKEADYIEMKTKVEQLEKDIEVDTLKIASMNVRFESAMQNKTEKENKLQEELELQLKESSEKEKLGKLEKVDLLKQVEELRTQLETVVELKDDFAIKVLSVEDTLEQLTGAAECSDQQVKQLQTEAAINSTAQAETEDQLREARAALQSTAARIEELNNANRELESKTINISSLEERQIELECENKELTEERNQITLQLEKLRAAHHGSSCTASAALERQVQELQVHCQAAETTNRDWKDKCWALEKLVEPFRDQLENYEAERATLLCTKTAAQKEVDSLSQKYVSLLGHQNHKQKIHHVAKLKAENNKLIEEVARYKSECERHRKLRRQEDRRKTVTTGAAGKENSSDAAAWSPLRPSNKLNKM